VKFRYVLIILAGLLLSAILFTVGTVASYKPNHYSFLGNQRPKEVTLQPDPVGWVGRQQSYYVLHEDSSFVTQQASQELKAIGWKRVANAPAIFRRGDHEMIDVRRADQTSDPKLLEGIPHGQLANYTIVEVVDPRMPPAFRQRIARWTRHSFRRFIHGSMMVG